MEVGALVERLRSMASEKNREGMARYGINPERALGISVRDLREIAREMGRDHALAAELWSTGIHEARILASIIDDPKQVTPEQMDAWVAEFDSWDLCDQCCGNLFDRTPYAFDKVAEWAGREREFEKRAGFSLLAYLSHHDKKSPDGRFAALLPLIKREATDGRNYVKKAVNWALREVGQRSAPLHAAALSTANEIAAIDSRAARWIAADAIRELTGPVVAAKLARKAGRGGK